MGMLQEFKEFAMRGNVVDLAVGVVIGAAFGKIVTSLVNDVIMPPIGWLIGGVDFSNLKWILVQPVAATATSPEIKEVAVAYGLFINTGRGRPASGSERRGQAADRDPRCTEVALTTESRGPFHPDAG